MRRRFTESYDCSEINQLVLEALASKHPLIDIFLLNTGAWVSEEKETPY
jgi:hypothetical protein